MPTRARHAPAVHPARPSQPRTRPRGGPQRSAAAAATDAASPDRILAAALAEFAAHGFAGARVDRVARTARVNKAMLYYHFTSKELLYQAVLEELFGRVAAFVARVLGDDLPAERRFEALAGFWVDVFESAPELRPLILREMAGGGERIREAFARILLQAGVPRKARAVFEDGIRQGRFRSVDPMHALTSFVGMNLFYLFFQPLVHSIWEIRDEEAFRKSRPKEVADIFLRGLEAR